ncbi:MAG TPA: polysaccharide deacetylase family protein [Edaphocola sp.]|nr:polysaccharide deacetylase family protein [Edaphocola sp.]
MNTNQQVLIYCEQITNRLQYVLEWIFQEQLQLDFRVTFDQAQWQAYEGMKINYSERRIEPEDILIRPHRLIYEAGETAQQLNINRWKKSTVLFYNQPGALIPFDLFSAVFYLISRYEEYLPFKKDQYGRFPASASVAHQFSFLQQPVVDEWLHSLKKILEKKFRVILPGRRFEFVPTYDIDIAWAYAHKPFKLNAAGAAKDLLRLKPGWFFDRMLVLSSGKTDPYDAYKWMEDLQKYFKLSPIYFFLVGNRGPYDRNIPASHAAMKKLIMHTSTHAQVGLHPSFGSFGKQSVMEQELHTLEQIIDKPVLKSRQHYLKMSLPETYHLLQKIGIQEDYTMGYSTVNGFRAGTSMPFFWYDLSNETKTTLRVHPFCFMDTTSISIYGNDKSAAYQEAERIIRTLRQVDGRFVSIFHNNNLGSGRESKGWYKLYQRMINQLLQ